MRSNLYLKSYRDHAYLKRYPAAHLYRMEAADKEDMYLYFDPGAEEVYSVKLVRIGYSNLGDPFREFCELVMMDCEDESIHYMFIDKEDALVLWKQGVHSTDDVIKRFKWENRLTSD